MLRSRAGREAATPAALKIFFGNAPGVGKTYTMLGVRLRLRAAGVDVAVGWRRDPRSRGDSRAPRGPGGIPPLRGRAPRRKLDEFDLDATLARRPARAAPRRAGPHQRPGRPPRQALAGRPGAARAGHRRLHDAERAARRVLERRRPPDHRRARARDRARSGARSRGRDRARRPAARRAARAARRGQGLHPEQASRAADNFFRRGNLLALRELSLRRAAERIDADVRAYRHDYDIKATWPAAEHILVCVGSSPSSARIIRGARRWPRACAPAGRRCTWRRRTLSRWATATASACRGIFCWPSPWAARWCGSPGGGWPTR
ncbi:MAG: hypothetical protein IPI34_14225 [bacterium]|nr:hypothetical protein [bacterium]